MRKYFRAQRGCKVGIFKFLAVGVKADRLKSVRNDFKSVYLFIETIEGDSILQVGTVAQT